MAVNTPVVDPNGGSHGGRESAPLAGETETAQSPRDFQTLIEIEIIQRFMNGDRLLDVGIGTGRLSLPHAARGIQVTGIDASAAMIDHCANDPRSASVRLVLGDLNELPFAAETFDTVMAVGTIVDGSRWQTNLDELIRVTKRGGRTIVGLRSRDHFEAVGRSRGLPSGTRLLLPGDVEPYGPQLRVAELREYASERALVLAAVVPYDSVLSTSNLWTTDSYAVASGGIERLVSWMGADAALFAFVEFLQRRIVQYSPVAISARMFAVFERRPDAAAYREPNAAEIALGDQRGPDAWHAEFAAHLEHEPNRRLAMALLLASRADRLPSAVLAQLPSPLLREFERALRQRRDGEASANLASAWRSAVGNELRFHGVDLAVVFERALHRELRAGLEPDA